MTPFLMLLMLPGYDLLAKPAKKPFKGKEQHYIRKQQS